MSRAQGFNGADGVNGEAEVSANQAFNKYLEEKGIPKTPKNKALFKKWIQDMKSKGTLSAIVTVNRKELDKAIVASAPTSNVVEQEIVTRSPEVAVAPVVVSTGLPYGLNPLAFGIVCVALGAVLVKAYDHFSKK